MHLSEGAKYNISLLKLFASPGLLFPAAPCPPATTAKLFSALVFKWPKVTLKPKPHYHIIGFACYYTAHED